MVRNRRFSDPKVDTNGLIPYPAPMPAKDPPAPRSVKMRLACLALNISPAKIQNWKMERIVTTSIQIYNTGINNPDRLDCSKKRETENRAPEIEITKI